MGIHPNLPFLKQLYDEGDALMVANMGGLVEVCAMVGRVKVTAEMRLNRAQSGTPHMSQEQTIHNPPNPNPNRSFTLPEIVR